GAGAEAPRRRMSAGLHVVVTGAGGFVGGYLARWLGARGNRVDAIVHRSRPSTPFPGCVSVLEGDVRAPAFLPARFDILIHCAAETPARCQDRDGLFA